MADFPDIPDHQQSLAVALNNLATSITKQSRPDESEEFYRKAWRSARSWSNATLRSRNIGQSSRRACSNWPENLKELGKHEEAQRLVERATLLVREELKAHPVRQKAANLLGIVRELAELMIALGDHAGAVGAVEDLARIQTTEGDPDNLSIALHRS